MGFIFVMFIKYGEVIVLGVIKGWEFIDVKGSELGILLNGVDVIGKGVEDERKFGEFFSIG